MTDLRQRAIALYDDFTHEHRDRRRFMRELAALAGSAAAAETLVAAIAPQAAAAQQVPADDPRLTAVSDTNAFAGKPLQSYTVWPKGQGAVHGVVLVIHENRGLNAHIRDVARRVALAGYVAVAPDFLSAQGGTPADEDRARDMIGQADYALLLDQAVALLTHVRSVAARIAGADAAPVRVGAVGFCWGGAFVNRLAVAAGDRLDAGVAYYGPAPDPSEAVKVQASLLLHYAGKDARVNATGAPWTAALRAAGKPVSSYTYENVDHAFNNDTSAARYDAGAAKLAWDRTLAFFAEHLRATD